jgi:hypothetical protein
MAVMRFARLYLTLILTSGEVCAQDTVANWFPVHVGDRWTYEYTTRDEHGEGRAHLEIHTWKTEETIVGSWVVPEGTLVARQVRVIEGSPRGRVDPNPAYLIRGDCLYAEYGETGWDPQTHQLTADFRKALDVGYVSPDFCFPLAVRKKWGAPHGLPDWGVTRPEEAKDWEVAGVKARDPSAPGGQKTFHVTSISGYPGAGITVDIRFTKGVGVIREEAIHHGTIGEERFRLLRFEPAAQR